MRPSLAIPRASLKDNPLSYEEVIHPDDRIQVLLKLEDATETGKFDERLRIVSANGESHWVWARGFSVRDDKGKIRRLVGTVLDITTQKLAEEEVARNLSLAKSAWSEQTQSGRPHWRLPKTFAWIAC